MTILSWSLSGRDIEFARGEQHTRAELITEIAGRTGMPTDEVEAQMLIRIAAVKEKKPQTYAYRHRVDDVVLWTMIWTE